MSCTLIALLTASAVLPGCASNWSRSYNRWQAMEASGTYATWSRCVDDYSRRYLESGSTETPPVWHDPKNSASDQVIFTWVLAACAKHMKGSGWDHIQPNEYQKLLNDAHNHFFGVRASLQAELDAQVI